MLTMRRTTAAFALLACCSGLGRADDQYSGAERDAAEMATTQPTHTNRLIDATSPYLLQHAHNPVDWHEWGPEALNKAKQEDKPIFLSIGYAACHWCHVMAHESFEDEATAEIMNKHFINIKVDREERPDLDAIYMQATMLLNNGQGGWPMSVWLTPDGKPFFAGTYFPPDARFGRPGFAELCERIGTLWNERREALLADARSLTEAVRSSMQAEQRAESQITLETIDKAAKQLAGLFDPDRGGLSAGGTNKFPPSMTMDLMLRYAKRHSGTPEAERMVELVKLTLDEMARGGIYDQLGGGIHRYSTDPQWLVPHFEKMLYDQALVSRAYIDGYLATGKEFYKDVAADIFDYVLEDLRSPKGGFYSTRDADSEGVEGKYYVWRKQEIIEALGDEAGALVCDYYGVTEQGNWRDPHDPDTPKNILHVVIPASKLAEQHGMDVGTVTQRLSEARRKLLDVRADRVPPGLDDKILAEWNGLMIAGLARGGAVLDEPKYVDAARDAAEFILDHQYKDGRLLRAYRDGRVLETAFLSDYAAMIEGLLELYEATFEQRWLDQALRLNEVVVRDFYDDDAGGFYFTPDAHEQLITRNKDIRDGATPSGNSVQLMNLLRLAVITGDNTLRERAEQTIDHLATEAIKHPAASERFLSAVEFAQVGPVEIAIVGAPDDSATKALVDRVNRTYLPNRVLMLRRPDLDEASVESPLLKQRTLVDGKPAAYVCRDYACRRPVTDPGALAEQLGAGKETH